MWICGGGSGCEARCVDRDVIVPPDEYFVLGDNRNDSEDSRYWGFVPRSAIVGRPLLVYFTLPPAEEIHGRLGAGAGSGCVSGWRAELAGAAVGVPPSPLSRVFLVAK